MKAEKELQSHYQGGLEVKIRLQNDELVKSLSGWLIESSLPSRWHFYSLIIKAKAEQGGAIILCERRPNDAWMATLMSKWRTALCTAALSIVHTFVNQLATPMIPDWEQISSELVPLAAKGDWIRSIDEALVVCSSCNHYMLSNWESVRNVAECPVCKSDVFKFLPAVIAPAAKEAILRGLLMEIAVAKAIVRVGGVLFKRDLGQLGEHYVSLQFQHPVSPVELDVIGDLQDTLLFVECKDSKPSEILAINELELTASKVGRLMKQLGDFALSQYKKPARLLFVTTGQLHKDLQRSDLKRGELSDVPCYVVDQSQLTRICDYLIEVSTS